MARKLLTICALTALTCLAFGARAEDPAPAHRNKPAQKTAKAATSHVPEGFVEMSVAAVMPSEAGQAVVLADAQKRQMLPIWIGGTEALSIQLRLERRRFERPLTHDLLDNLVRELGGELIKVHIDDLKGSTFVATLFVKKGDRTVEIDARPSDSIALALGARIPIYVSKKVIERAGAPFGEHPRPASKQNVQTL